MYKLEESAHLYWNEFENPDLIKDFLDEEIIDKLDLSPIDKFYFLWYNIKIKVKSIRRLLCLKVRKPRCLKLL